MSDKPVMVPDAEPASEPTPAEAELQGRRDFLIGLGRWSKAAIGVAVLGGLVGSGSDAAAGAWINNRGGGGGWINGGGGWINRRGGSWINRR